VNYLDAFQKEQQLADRIHYCHNVMYASF
jgi:hypothetical protein